MYNRWLIVVIGFIIFFCLGAVYAWSLFIVPLERDFGWTRAEVTVAFSLAILVFAFTMFIPGRILDAWGPRITATTAAIFCFAAYFFASRIDSLWELYLSYGVLGGLACSFGFSSGVATTLKWFPDKRGLAIGLVVAGVGASALFFSPIIVALMGPEEDWAKAFFTLAIAFGLVILVAAQFLRNPPKDWMPTVGAKQPPLAKPALTIKDFTWQEMIRTSAFWKSFTMFCFGGAPGLLFIGHLAAFGEGLGFTLPLATLAVSILALGNTTGRMLWGAISDRIGIERTLFIIYGIQGLLYIAIAAKDIGILGLLFPLFATLSLLSGAVYGGNLALMGPTCAKYFGTKHIGTNFGLLYISWGLSGVLGPSLGGWVFVATGDYFWALIIVAVISFMVALVALTTRAPGVK